MKSVKLDPDLGEVRRCPLCRDWWPNDSEFYYTRPGHGLSQTQCRACIADRNAKRPVPLRPVTHGSALNIEAKRARDRERKAQLRRDPILGDKLRERERRAQQAYYERNAAQERARHREWYANRVGRPVREGFGRPRMDDAA